MKNYVLSEKCFQFSFDGHYAKIFLPRFEKVEKPVNEHIGLRLLVYDTP